MQATFSHNDNVTAHDFADWPAGLDGDFKGEVLAAEFVANGLPLNKICFKALGTHKRPVENDIANVSVHVDANGLSMLELALNREGIYDMLPEGITHYKTAPTPDNEKGKVLKEIADAKKNEADARKFFETFENEFFYARLRLELQERALLNLAMPQSAQQLFATLFGGGFTAPPQQMAALLHVLPLIHQIQGDITKMQYCLCQVLQTDVKMECVSPRTLCKYTGQLPALGLCALGVDAVAGNSFVAQWPLYKIDVVNIPRAAMPLFFNNGQNHRLLSYMLGYLLPANAGYTIALHLLKDEKKGCTLTDANGQNAWHLGYDTYI
jgi:hypothetical protein